MIGCQWCKISVTTVLYVVACSVLVPFFAYLLPPQINVLIVLLLELSNRVEALCSERPISCSFFSF